MRLKTITIRLEAIAVRLKAIAFSLGAMASRLDVTTDTLSTHDTTNSICTQILSAHRCRILGFKFF